METLAPSPSPGRSFLSHRISVILLTFSAYAAFHASRKPPSIVKPALAPDPSSRSSGWPPFDGPQGPRRLGELDLAFLLFYSASMFLAGHAGDRLDLRLLLFLSMLFSGAANIAFGLSFFFQIHHLAFFVSVQIFSGLVQSFGWPCVVSVVGNWFGKSRRGLIMGFWNSHTSVGNIIGAVIAAAVLEFGWGWSFVLPGVLIIVVGIFVWVFLVVDPRDVGFPSPTATAGEVEMDSGGNGPGGNPPAAAAEEIEWDGNGNGGGGNPDLGDGEEVGLLELGAKKTELESVKAIGFVEAWKLPGVGSFAGCLFCSKLVAYTFLYWLPFYIRHTAVAGKHLSQRTAGMLSTIFDVGGVLGGISAGFISDWLDARATTSVIFLVFSIPALILYRAYGSISMLLNISLMLLSGFFVNGPYALITTAVATDLGTQDSIKGNARALATVTAIIDGTGSVGAALGPLFAGYASTWGWNYVFLMLVIATSCAIMCLISIAKAEVTSSRNESNLP